MAYADQEMGKNRIFALIIVALIHILVGYTLVTGLAYSAAQNVLERVTTVDIEEPEDIVQVLDWIEEAKQLKLSLAVFMDGDL